MYTAVYPQFEQWHECTTENKARLRGKTECLRPYPREKAIIFKFNEASNFFRRFLQPQSHQIKERCTWAQQKVYVHAKLAQQNT